MRNLVQDELFSIYSYLNIYNTLLAADLNFFGASQCMRGDEVAPRLKLCENRTNSLEII